jgi:hypothetical protein
MHFHGPITGAGARRMAAKSSFLRTLWNERLLIA